LPNGKEIDQEKSVNKVLLIGNLEKCARGKEALTENLVPNMVFLDIQKNKGQGPKIYLGTREKDKKAKEGKNR